MDPVVLAQTALAVLTPYLTAAGSAAAKKAGEALYDALARRLQKEKDDTGEEVLERAATNLDVFGPSLTRFLELRAQDDEAFCQWLAAAVEPFSGKSIQATGKSAVVEGHSNVVGVDHSVAVGGDLSGEVHLDHKD